jgi:hypothetical protein
VLVAAAGCPSPASEEERFQAASPAAVTQEREPYALPGSSVRDEQGRLVKLWLKGPDDATLREVVKNSPHLKLLGLHDCQASREGLLPLNELEQLEELEFRDGNPTRNFVDLIHLAKIADHESLECLGTGHTSFAKPEDFQVLKKLKSLRSLEAALSLEQEAELKKALPNCSIFSE